MSDILDPGLTFVSAGQSLSRRGNFQVSHSVLTDVLISKCLKINNLHVLTKKKLFAEMICNFFNQSLKKSRNLAAQITF